MPGRAPRHPSSVARSRPHAPASMSHLWLLQGSETDHFWDKARRKWDEGAKAACAEKDEAPPGGTGRGF